MPAYLIANVDIKDTEKFKDYMKATPSIIKQFGGKFLVRGGDFEICEGNWNPKRLVVVELIQDWLFSYGHDEIWLLATPDPKLRASGFYKKLGWEKADASDDGHEILKLYKNKI